MTLWRDSLIEFDHYGIAISERYMKLMNHLDWVYDHNQDINVALSGINEKVEYVCGKSVNRYINKPFYHTCYRTDDIDYHVEQYEKFGYIKILDTNAVLFDNRRIVFIINNEESIVEFLECKK